MSIVNIALDYHRILYGETTYNLVLSIADGLKSAFQTQNCGLLRYHGRCPPSQIIAYHGCQKISRAIATI
jgi:phosphatidylethanolamine-binding protein (PEBP) family uncharacterized protein